MHRSGGVVNWRVELRHMENVQEGKPLNHPGSLCPPRPWCRGRDKWDGAGGVLVGLVR